MPLGSRDPHRIEFTSYQAIPDKACRGWEGEWESQQGKDDTVGMMTRSKGRDTS